MKKLANSLICICLLFAIVGCGSKKDTNNEQTKNDNQIEETLNFIDTNKAEEVSREDDAGEGETQSSPEIETPEMIYEVVDEETSLYSYVRKVKKVEGSTTKFDIKTTNYVYKENIEGEPQMLFTCYNDQEKATYQYFFLNNKDAVEWIKENGDKNKTYTMIDPDGIYDNTMKASWYDETGWEVGMVGARGSITLDEYASGKPFVKKEAPSSSKDNNACTLDEFMEMYDTDFDSDEDAEDWWFDYGCESPY